MKEDIQWYEFVINNAAEIVLIFGAIFGSIKLLIDWDVKKREISFTKIQENKLIEAKEFFKSYQSLRNSLQFFFYQTRHGTHKDKVFDKIRDEIQENYIDFDYKSMVLKLFMEKKDIQTIENIMTNCELIKIDIETWHIYKYTSEKPENYKGLSEVKAEYFDKVLPDLIREIETSLRGSYNLN